MRTSTFRKCISYSHSNRPFPRFSPSPSFSHLSFSRAQSSKTTHRNATNYAWFRERWSSSARRGFTISLVVGTGIACSIITTKPLRLESNNPEFIHNASVAQNYQPVLAPLSIDQATDVLRWEESSTLCGMGSGVVRYDQVRVASNVPCEDSQNAASGLEENEIRWLLWGVFDGHAYVLHIRPSKTKLTPSADGRQALP